MTTMYLSGEAKLWWQTRVSKVFLWQTKIEKWEDMKMELKKQFLPSNTSWLARDSLRKLKHSGTVRDYVRKHKLCVKKEKCELCKEEITFLGHVIKQGRIFMDKRKITIIIDSLLPPKLLNLSFLGLANYYRKFIKGYSKLMAP